MVATGTLPNGSPVILKADGTVEVVAESSIAISIPTSEYIYSSGSSNWTSAAFDPSNANRFVVSYRNNTTTYGVSVVGTVSGTSISFGSEYVFNTGGTSYIDMSFDSNTSGRFVVTYNDEGNSNYGTAIVGTVSGTSITFGSEYVFNSAGTYQIDVEYDPSTTDKFVVAYLSYSNFYGTSIVGTVSGSSISYGTAAVVSANEDYSYTVSFDPNTTNSFVVTYKYSGPAGTGGTQAKGRAVVGTLSGTTISYGSPVEFNSSSSSFMSADFDSSTAGKFIVAYQDIGNSSYGTAIVGTVSGTNITFGSEYVFNSGATEEIHMATDKVVAGKFVVAYTDSPNTSQSTAIVGTVSGTVISYSAEYVFSGTSYWHAVTFDSTQSGVFIIAYRDSSNLNYGTAIVGQAGSTTTNLTSTNLLGISQKAVANGETTSVETLGGLSAVHSGLTIGSDYYVATDGSLTTTSTDNVSIGKAVAATTLNMRDYV